MLRLCKSVALVQQDLREIFSSSHYCFYLLLMILFVEVFFLILYFLLMVGPQLQIVELTVLLL